MNTTIEERKQRAIKCLEKLKINKLCINEFKKNNQVPFFDEFGGYWVYQEPEIEEKMKEIEKKYDCICYAVIKNPIEGDEVYDFLTVGDPIEEMEDLEYKDKAKNQYYAFVYRWSKFYDYCKSGLIAVQSYNGIIKRIDFWK